VKGRGVIDYYMQLLSLPQEIDGPAIADIAAGQWMSKTATAEIS